MYTDPALTPYIEEAQQFNSQLGDLLRPALDTPEAIAAQRRRIDQLADQQLARGPAASTPPAEERVLPGGTPARITRPGRLTAAYQHLHAGGWIIGSARAADLPNAHIATTCDVAAVSVDYQLAPEHPLSGRPRRLRERRPMAVLNRAGRVRHGALADRGRIIGSHPRRDDTPSTPGRRLLRRREPRVRLLRHGADHPQPAAGDRHTRHRPPLPGGHAAAHLRRPERRATARSGDLPLSTPTSRDSHRPCSPWGLSIRSSTTRCSWQRAGRSRGTRRRSTSTRKRRTGSSASPHAWPLSRDSESKPSSPTTQQGDPLPRDLKHQGLAEGPPKRGANRPPARPQPDGPDQDTCFNFRPILTAAAQNIQSGSHRCL
jgi:hypothetical protein